MKRTHSMPFGAECREDGSVRFRLWAPAARQVELCLADSSDSTSIDSNSSDSTRLAMERKANGWYELATDYAKPGSRYRFRIDGGQEVPDPASRYQPSDVHGPSEVVNPAAFEIRRSRMARPKLKSGYLSSSCRYFTPGIIFQKYGKTTPAFFFFFPQWFFFFDFDQFFLVSFDFLFLD